MKFEHDLDAFLSQTWGIYKANSIKMQNATHAAVELMLDSLPEEVQDMHLGDFNFKLQAGDELIREIANRPFTSANRAPQSDEN